MRAGLVDAPSRYRWSSAAAHVRGRNDVLVRVAPLLELAPPWRGFLARVIREEDVKLNAIARAHGPTARRRGIPRDARARPRPNSQEAEARTQATAPTNSPMPEPPTQAGAAELDMVSPEPWVELNRFAVDACGGGVLGSECRGHTVRAAGGIMIPTTSPKLTLNSGQDNTYAGQ